jgi:hypothetical protein
VGAQAAAASTQHHCVERARIFDWDVAAAATSYRKPRARSRCIAKKKLRAELGHYILELEHAIDLHENEHRARVDLVTHSIAGY